MTRKIVFSPEAQADLLQLYDTIADRDSPARAFAYTGQACARSGSSAAITLALVRLAFGTLTVASSLGR